MRSLIKNNQLISLNLSCIVCGFKAWSRSLSYHHPQPEKIELTADEFNEIESEIKLSNLRPKTKEMLTKSLHFMVWLQITAGILKKLVAQGIAVPLP